jgi:AcrR family transcriptional regulator
MPKSLTDSERAYIKKRLMEEAQDCLKQFGYRKTTVDEIVRRANIPKGTFYLFYESKELLIFDVILQLHDEIHAELTQKLLALEDPVTAVSVTALIVYFFRAVEGSFLYNLMTGGDIELLMRKLPPETLEAHALKDDLSIENFLKMAPALKEEEVRAFSAAFRAVFLSMIHKREIGEEVFDDALKLMIHGLVVQMFGEASV